MSAANEDETVNRAAAGDTSEQDEAREAEQEADPSRTSLIIISDFVCPWCYLGMSEIGRLREDYDIDVRFAPYLLDPSTPLEGKPARYRTAPDAPKTPIETRGEALGLTYTRGREWTSNSLLAHEAAEHISEHEPADVAWEFHRLMFKAYFTDLQDIAKQELLLETASQAGADVDALRASLEQRTYQSQVMDGLRWARQIGVTGVPTFVFDERYGVSGAQELDVFRAMMDRLGKRRKDGSGGESLIADLDVAD